METNIETITIKREDLNLFTVHDATEEIKKIVELTPEQEFRVHAIIKRHGHCEKLGTYQRLSLYHKDFSKEGFAHILSDKLKTHEKMSSLTDEEMVTYNVGSHTYKQGKE